MEQVYERLDGNAWDKLVASDGQASEGRRLTYTRHR